MRKLLKILSTIVGIVVVFFIVLLCISPRNTFYCYHDDSDNDCDNNSDDDFDFDAKCDQILHKFYRNFRP